MGRQVSESTEAWYARAVRELQVALAEEDAHWSRLVQGLSPANGHLPILDEPYENAVERVNHAQYQMFEAAKARNLEQHL